MDLVKLGAYHVWANDRARKLLEGLTEEEFSRELLPPYNSIRNLCLHIVLAIDYNIQTRVEGKDTDPYQLGDWLHGLPKDELLEHWRSTDLRLMALADSNLDLDAVFPNFLGEGEMKVGHTDFYLQYLVPAVHHRAQIMSALRLMGKEPVGTDYLFYLSHLHAA